MGPECEPLRDFRDEGDLGVDEDMLPQNIVPRYYQALRGVDGLRRIAHSLAMPPRKIPEPARVSQADYRALAEFRYTLRGFLHFSGQAAESARLSPQQHQVLLAIKGFPGSDGASIGELAERLHVRHHSAVGLVDRLMLRKLVTRKTSAIDRRRVHVRLSPRGETLIDRLSASHREELRRLGPVLRQLLCALGVE